MLEKDPIKKISIICPSLAGGGAERVAVNLANHYTSLGYEVDLVLFSKKGEYLNMVGGSVYVVDLNVSRTRYVFFKLLSYLRSQKSDTTIFPVIREANILVGLASYFVKCDNIVFREANTLDAVNMMTFCKRIFYKSAMSWSYRKAKKIIANSNDTKTDLEINRIVRGQNVQVIFNPVLASGYEDLARAPIGEPWLNNDNLRVVLGVGRLHYQKNFEFLIEVFSEVANQNDVARLIIVGAGSEFSTLSKLIVRLGLSEKVKIIDFQDNIFPYFNNAHVFALTSRWEGFGNVIVESLSCGLPVIATDCSGGPRMILDNGKYGKLITPNNKKDFVEALLSTLSKPKKRNDDLRKIAYNFSVERIAKKYLEVLIS